MRGHLAHLFGQAGLAVTCATALTLQIQHATFEQWWNPFTLGAGPAGAYVDSLDHEHRTALREHCRARLALPVTLSATAWAVTSHT